MQAPPTPCDDSGGQRSTRTTQVGGNLAHEALEGSLADEQAGGALGAALEAAPGHGATAGRVAVAPAVATAGGMAVRRLNCHTHCLICLSASMPERWRRLRFCEVSCERACERGAGLLLATATLRNGVATLRPTVPMVLRCTLLATVCIMHTHTYEAQAL